MKRQLLSILLIALVFNQSCGSEISKSAGKELEDGNTSETVPPQSTTPVAGDDYSHLELEAGETRNGGYGVLVNGRLVSLDLAMRNVHENPYLSTSTPHRISAAEEQIVRYHLAEIVSSEVQEIVIAKLAELKANLQGIKTFLPVGHLIENMSAFTWVQHAHLPCLDVQDDDNPYPNKKQVAYRYQNTIRFCQDFGYLDAGNQAAVVMHEIVYAALTNKSTLLEFVGYVFSNGYKAFTVPAQIELKRLAETLASYLQDNHGWIFINAVHPIAQDLRISWPENIRNHACFGSGSNGKETLKVLWQDRNSCDQGERKKDSFQLNFSSQPTQLLIQNKAVGALTAGSEELVSLCSGSYTGICSLNMNENNWGIALHLPSDTIHDAAAAGNLTRVQYLVANGTSVDTRDNQGAVPLIIAARNGHERVVEWLIVQGALIDARDNDNLSALHFAFTAKQYDIVRQLAVSGADVNSDRLLIGALGDRNKPCDDRMVSALLESPSIDVNYGDPLREIMLRNGSYPCAHAIIASRTRTNLALFDREYLAMAAGFGWTRIFELLVGLPVNPNLPAYAYNPSGSSYTGTAACHLILRGDMISLKRLLLRPDIETDDPTLCDGGLKTTPIDLSIRVNSSVALGLLLNYGTSLESYSYFSGSDYIQPLMRAAVLGRVEMIQSLISQGAPIDPTTHRWNLRPLFYAVNNRQISAVKILVEAGADVNVNKVLCEAEKAGAIEVASYLITHGAICEQT